MIRPTRILITLFCIASTGQSHASYEEWGAFATAFLLPLTYEAHKTTDFGSQPEPEDLEILEKIKPAVYIAPGGLFPIDFYEDYLPYCLLRDSKTDRPHTPGPFG